DRLLLGGEALALARLHALGGAVRSTAIGGAAGLRWTGAFEDVARLVVVRAQQVVGREAHGAGLDELRITLRALELQTRVVLELEDGRGLREVVQVPERFHLALDRARDEAKVGVAAILAHFVVDLAQRVATALPGRAARVRGERLAEDHLLDTRGDRLLERLEVRGARGADGRH